jgi:hypothetical protein
MRHGVEHPEPSVEIESGTRPEVLLETLAVIAKLLDDPADSESPSAPTGAGASAHHEICLPAPVENSIHASSTLGQRSSRSANRQDSTVSSQRGSPRASHRHASSARRQSQAPPGFRLGER